MLNKTQFLRGALCSKRSGQSFSLSVLCRVNLRQCELLCHTVFLVKTLHTVKATFPLILLLSQHLEVKVSSWGLLTKHLEWILTFLSLSFYIYTVYVFLPFPLQSRIRAKSFQSDLSRWNIPTTWNHPGWGRDEKGPDGNIMTCLRSKWIMFQYQSGRRNTAVEGRERAHVLDADGFKLLPLFSIRHEAFTSLIFQTRRGGLTFRVNELSVHPSPCAPPPPPPCFHSLLKVEMLVHGLWSCSGVSHFAAQMPLVVQLPILTCNRAWPCIWSHPPPPPLFAFLSGVFFQPPLFFRHY